MGFASVQVATLGSHKYHVKKRKKMGFSMISYNNLSLGPLSFTLFVLSYICDCQLVILAVNPHFEYN